MPPLRKFSRESIRAVARNPNIDIHFIGIYSRSDLKYPYTTVSRTPNENGHNPKTINLPKFKKTCRNCRIFIDIYAQDYCGYFKDIKDYKHSNGEKNRPQDISPIIIFSFINLKNEILAFLGWRYCILERLTILYAMFNLLGFFFSLLKEVYNTCAIRIQVNKQASVARILFAEFFKIFFNLG